MFPTPMDEAVARWREIERSLGVGAPLNDEARAYLLEVAIRLNWLLDDTRLKPEAAAKLVPEALGLPEPS